MKKAISLQGQRVHRHQSLWLLCVSGLREAALSWDCFPSGLCHLLGLHLSLLGAFRGTFCTPFRQPARGSRSCARYLSPLAHTLLTPLIFLSPSPVGQLLSRWPLVPSPSLFPRYVAPMPGWNGIGLHRDTSGGILSCCFSNSGPQTTCIRVALGYLLRIQTMRSHPRPVESGFLVGGLGSAL